MTEPTQNLEVLHALVDGELVGTERDQAMAWVNSDERAAQEYSNLIQLKRVLGGLPVQNPEPETWRACVGRLNEIDRSRKTEAFVGKYAWALCSAVAVLIVSGGLLSRMSGHRLGAQDVTSMGASLVPSLLANHPSASIVPKLISTALGDSPVQGLGPVEVVRAEAGSVRGVRLVRLTLQDFAGPMVLYVLRDGEVLDGLDPMTSDSRMSTGHLGDLNCVAWNREGFVLLLAGSRGTDELAQVASTLVLNKR